MLGLFGRSKPLSTVEVLSLEKDISEARKIRYILEVEGKICSLDPEFSASGNLRKVVHRLNNVYNSAIYKEECNCDYKQKAKLNLDGTPRKHIAYKKDWAS
jgi:hypothetical protein